MVTFVSATPASVKKINNEINKANDKAANAGEEIIIDPKTNEVEDPEEAANAAKEEELQKELEKIPMPPALNIENFDEVTSKQLTFVEFFSPYCSHCLALAPTWEKTYKLFKDEMAKLNIEMKQVNCVESGDLCEREEIFAYPNLRLYSPERDRESGEYKPGKLKFVDSYPRNLMRTEDNFKKYMKNSVAEFNSGSIDLPSASIGISVDEILKLITGEHNNEEPVFVTFFPASDKQWKMTDENGKSQFDRSCLDCIETKQTWDKLSNHILSIVKTGHFNCFTNPTVCEKLGFQSLTHPGTRSSPKFVMFLPRTAGILKIDYNGDINVNAMKKWATKLYENFQYDTVNAKDLTEVMEFRKNLPFEPLNSYYPLANKISVVLFYDIDTVTEEDKAILPYLLELVTKSPFNINLYTAKHKKIETNIETQAKNLVEFINYDENAKPWKFDRSLFLASTLTTKPTLYVFRDNTLFTSVYQSFAPEDIRDVDKLDNFIKANQYPLYQELTPELFEHYFNGKGTDDKIVVTFIDSEDAQRTNKEFYNISIAAHEYHYMKKQYYFEKLNNDRENKYEKVKKLKDSKADSTQVIKAMREEIPHYFNDNEVLFTFIDLANEPEMIKKLGWNINGEKYQPGDSIIVSRDDKYYWNQNLQGEQLTNDPYKMKPILQALLEGKSKLLYNLVGSPFGKLLRYMDIIHSRGLFGYIQLIALIYAAYFIISKLKGKKWKPSHGRSRSAQGLGILGDINLPKKD